MCACMHVWVGFHFSLQPNYLENRGPREAGNYDNYMGYLDKLKLQRQERDKDLVQRRVGNVQFLHNVCIDSLL